MFAESWWWLLVALGAVLLFELLRRSVHRLWARWRGRWRANKAGRAERDAAKLLRRAGYSIEAVQPSITWTVLVDGEPHPVDLRADYLVRAGRQRFVAEVKSGQRAPRLDTAATRRQLLEYRLAYAVDGVLLVDMTDRRIREVCFPLADG